MAAKECILVVEDEIIVAEDIQKILKDYGYLAPKIISTGEETIQYVKKNQPDLILMDIMLRTQLNGIEVAKEISNLDIPIIYITAYSDSDFIKQAKLTEPFGYLLKPFRERELIATIEMALYKHKMEKMLKESENKFRTLVETTKESICVVDEDENITFSNNASAEIFGCPVSELVGQNLNDFVIDEEFKKILSQTDQRKNNKSSRYEVEITRKNGVKRIISVNASPKFTQGLYKGAFGIFNDITEEKQKQQQLKEAKDNYQRIFENIQDVYCEIDFDGILHEISPSVEEMSSYIREELIGKSINDIYFDCNEKDAFLSKITKEGLVTDYYLKLKDKDGSTMLCSVNAKLVRNDKTGTIKIIGSLRNITDRKESEVAIHNSEERYKRLFESSIDAIMMLNHKGIFEYNNATLKLFKVSDKKELLNQSISDVSPLKQPNGESSQLAANRHLEKAYKNGYNKFEWVLKKKNGDLFTAEIWLTAFSLNNKDVIQATIRDLSFKKKTLEKLQKAHDEVKEKINQRTKELIKTNEFLQKQINDKIHVEDALQHKTLQQELLLKTARYINSSLDVIEVLRRIAIEVMDLLNSYGCTIYLLAEDSKTLLPQIVIDPVYEKEIMSTPLDIENSFTGKAVKAKESLMFNDAVQNTNGYQIPGTTEEENERIIAAPFVAEGKVLGAICLNRIGPYFTREDLALVDTFANYAATAIKNAQTYQKLQHEIEERNLAEKARRESEKRYKDLQTNVPVGIFRATPEGKLLAANPALFEMFGYESEEDFITIPTPQLYFRPKDRIMLMEELRSKSEIYDFEVQLLKKNGEIFWCSLSIKTIPNEKGEWIYQDGMITDISERKLSELTQNVLYNIGNAVNSTKDLQEFFKTIHHELAKIIRTKNFYIALYDKSSNLITSPYYVDQFNKKTPPQQELGQGLTAYVIRTGKSLFLDKKRRDKLMKDGVIANYKWKSKLWLGVPLKINNEVIGAMAVQSYENEKAFEKKDLKVLEFVSDQVAIAVHRKRAEEALRDSEQLNRAVIDNSPLGISVRDKNGKLLIANKAWKKFWNKTKKQIESERQKKTSFNFDKRDQYLSEHLPDVKKVYKKGGEYYIPELEISSKNKTKWISHYFYAIQDRDSRVDKVVIITEDITQRKRAEEKLLRTQLRLATLFKYVPNIILYETGGKQEFMSENIINLLGFPAEDFIEDKNKFTTLIHPEDQKYIQQKYKEWEKSGKTDLLTLWFRVKKSDGSYMWIEDRMVEIVPENEKTYRAGVKIDISNLKKSEEELKDSYKKLQRLLEETINGLVSAVEMRDPYTAGHQRRVATLAGALAREMGLPKDQIDGLNLAALVHDIGKINVPAEILSKPGKLTPAEFDLIKMHPQTGFDILKSIEFPWPVAEVVLQHQERLDGSAYPQGLKGDEISLNARIISVADVIEAMSSHRPYRPSLGIDVALEEIKKNRDILYDPDVVDACMILFNEKGFEFKKEEKPDRENLVY